MPQTATDNKPFNLFFWIFIALLPFVQAPALIDFTLIPRQLFLGAFILITAGIGLYRFKQSGNVQLGVLELSFLAFLLVQLLAAFFAINQAEAAATFSRYSAYAGYFFLLSYSISNQKVTLEALCKAFLVFSTIAVGFTALELLKALNSGKFWEDIYVIKASFGHKNILSAVLMLGIPFQVLLYRQKEKLWSGLALVMLFVSLLEIFLLRTRGVWLATLFGGLVSLVSYFIWVKGKSAQGQKLPVVPLVAAFGVVLLVGGGLLLNKNVGSQVGDLSNLNRRTVFWENSLQMIQDNPLTGVGPGNWKIHFPKYGLENMDVVVQEGITNIQRPHNDYLWVWSEAGFLGLLTYLGIFIGALAFAIKIMRTKEYETAMIVSVLVGGLAAYMLFSFADFPLERISPVIMVLTFITVIAGYAKSELVTISGKVYQIIPVVLAVVALGVGYYRWEGERNAVKVLQANATRNAQAMINTAADAENVFFNMDNYANPLLYFSGLGYAVQKNYKLAEIELLGALNNHPNHVLSLYSMGNNYKYQNNVDKALEYYGRALEIAPMNPRLRVSMAEVYLKQNKVKEATALLNEVKVSYADPRYKEMMASVVAYYYNNFEKEKTWPALVDFLKQRNPKTANDFFNGYAAFKKQ